VHLDFQFRWLALGATIFAICDWRLSSAPQVASVPGCQDARALWHCGQHNQDAVIASWHSIAHPHPKSPPDFSPEFSLA